MGHFSVEIYAPPGSTLSANQQHDLKNELGRMTGLFPQFIPPGKTQYATVRHGPLRSIGEPGF